MLRVILEDAQGFNLQDGRGILKIDSLSSGFQEEELSRERNEEAAMSFFFFLSFSFILDQEKIAKEKKVIPDPIDDRK